MRLICPHCGTRDRREFTCQGAALAADRPGGDWSEAWDRYLHLRENPAGPASELWYHQPCGTWIEMRRDTLTHAVHGSRLASEARG